MKYLNVMWTSLLSIFVLFIFAKLLGNKQISQLSLFDYIIGISIGSIASEMATNIDRSPWIGIISMTIYALADYIISFITTKSVGFRKIVTGRTIVLYSNNMFYKKNMNKAKLDLSDLLTLCRMKGFFSLSDIQTIILEHNGNLSILPFSTKRPVTPSDLDIEVENDSLIANVIMDGKMMSNNLKVIGKNDKWLLKRMKSQGYKKVSDIMLATVDNDDNLSIYTYDNSIKDPDIFE